MASPRLIPGLVEHSFALQLTFYCTTHTAALTCAWDMRSVHVSLTGKLLHTSPTSASSCEKPNSSSASLSHTLGEGRRRIYRARGLFLRCFDAPPARHSARLAARARDSGHFGAWRRAEPVAICLPPAAYPDPRPRPFPRQPADPPHRDTALMQARTHTQRLPFTGGRGRSAAGHLHSHITPHAKLPDMGYRISNEFVLTL